MVSPTSQVKATLSGTIVRARTSPRKPDSSKSSGATLKSPMRTQGAARALTDSATARSRWVLAPETPVESTK
eukprot:6192342-Pyramimonas_sp.AAC.2